MLVMTIEDLRSLINAATYLKEDERKIQNWVRSGSTFILTFNPQKIRELFA